jgi:serine/threonine-protein kinase
MSGFNPDRWRALSPHLDRALEMTEHDRGVWLASLRADDPTLAAELTALLEERDLLEREAFLEEGAASRLSLPSLAGQTFGAYTLVSQIGHGGTGSVWLARRSDGRFEGQAAIKLLDVSLVGRAGGERFRREGNILARLSHPHIARLIDAGFSPLGQPYLVLEHVDGQPIDAYCDSATLGVDARIRLFLDVLDAVEHAHANLIVHRDIKPSNVLAARDGRIKLLDFGIAKLLETDAPGVETTALTREGGVVLTPEYAAPEQVTAGPITTATDVYALGVLLYLLLAGKHPAGDTRRPPSELLRAILETEPPPLSDAAAPIRTAGPETQRNAASRGTTPDKLRRLLHGDLDTIVARALKKDPRERYPSVTALADDLRRYLDHEPIAARRDTLRYRAAKFVQRHRTTVATAALAILALLAGLAGTITEARRATRQAMLAEAQRRRADREARAANEQRDFAIRQLSRAEAINDLNTFLLSDAAPAGRPFNAGDLLAAAERIAERQEADADERRVDTLVAIGRLYEARDQEGKARALLSKAHALSLEVSDRSVRANAACALAGPTAAAGEFDRAENLIRGALDDLGDAPQFALHRVSCLRRWSYVAAEGGDAPGAVAHALAAQCLLRASRQGSSLSELAVSMDVAEAYRMAGRNREAAAEFEKAFARLSALGRDRTERAGTLLNNWGLAVQILGRPLEAERLFRQAIAIGSADGTESGVSPMLLNNLARVLLELDRLPEAAGYAERASARARQAGDEIVVNQALSVLFRTYVGQRRFARAGRVLAELERRWKRMMPPGHMAFALLPAHEAILALGRGDGRAAAAKADRAVALTEANPQGLDYLPTILLRRAEIRLAVNLPHQAREDAERALAMAQEAAAPDTSSSTVGLAFLMLARALRAQGEPAESRDAFASALGHLEPTLGQDHPQTRLARRLAAQRPSSES